MLYCENRNKLNLTGIDKVESVSPTQIVTKTNQSSLVVLGTNLHINKLDVMLGNVEIVGEVEQIKYALKKQSIFKRIFK